MADRYSYLPLVGLFVIVIWESSDLLRRCPRPVFAATAAALVALGALGAVTFNQVLFWEDSAVLFRRALAVTTENAFAHNNLGDAIYRQDPREAGMHYQAALAIGLHPELTLMNLGRLLEETGRTEQAKQMYLEALRREPSFASAHCKLALMAMAEQNYPEAIAHWRRALQSEPEWAEVSNNLAWILATCGNPALRDGPEAVRLAERACKLAGPGPSYLDTLAAAYAEAGRFPDAIATIQKALSLTQAGEPTDALLKFRSRLELYRQERPYHQP